MDTSNDHVEIIREAFRYTQAFRGKTFVFQLDDAVVTDPVISALMRDLVLLQRAGIRIVLVAGARKRIDEVLERYRITCDKREGVRISSSEAIPFIKMAAFDIANRIMTSLSGLGVNAVIGNWVRARSLGVVEGVDYKDAGAVDKIRVDLLRGVVDQGSIPILPCIGWSPAGKPYNLSSRELAADLSSALQASKLFFVAEFDGIFPDRYAVDARIETAPNGRVSRMNVDQARHFLSINTERPDDLAIELLKLALVAAGGGVERVHLVDGRSDGAILREIFSNLGVGTMIHANQYQSIRAMRREDVTDIYRLMRPLVEHGLLIHRSESELADRHEDFVVFETDGMVHGCGALHLYGSDQGEIAALAVDRMYDHFGIGQRVTAYLIDRARAAGLRRIFALTTQASDWFEQLGFTPGTVDDIPAEKQEQYDYKRRSRVFLLDL